MSCLRLGQRFILFEQGKESPLLHVLQDQIDAILIIEEAVNFQNVSVVEETLDLELQDELVDHEVRLDHLLGNLLDCENGPS